MCTRGIVDTGSIVYMADSYCVMYCFSALLTMVKDVYSANMMCWFCNSDLSYNPWIN